MHFMIPIKRLWVALLFCMAYANSTLAYDVEADSVGNSIFLLLTNATGNASYDTISVANTVPSFVSYSTASIVPASVSANGSDLAALEFSVDAAAPLGATGSIIVTVSGMVSGQPVDVVVPVSITVVASAAEAQGFVGSGVPMPDVGGVDSDMDGITDALETAYGSDPFFATSIPGALLSVDIPLLGSFASLALFSLLLLLGSPFKRRVKAQRATQGRR
jgi:hypothetical protein